MLFNEPKLLKFNQRRAERRRGGSFSALQRAEIAEIADTRKECADERHVSVLFNEPKLLKSVSSDAEQSEPFSFSALQRAEIAEIARHQFVARII